jgi:mannose-6-phosphate isomerase-like protein (cupin superfamily)
MSVVTSSESLPWKPFSVENSQGYDFKFNLIDKEYTDAYSIDLVRVAPGGYSPVHFDPDNHAFFFIEGNGTVTIAGEASDVGPGSVVKIPFGALHAIRNTGEVPLVFLTIYDPPRVRGKQ